MANDRAIVRGKRQCVFMREENTFSLVVICDESWQDQTNQSAKNDYIIMFNLSTSAACLWAMLQDCPTKPMLQSRVATRFGISRETAQNTVSHFLQILSDYALINYAPCSEAEKISPYQLGFRHNAFSTDDITFNVQDITIEPVKLKQEVFCGSSGYDSPCAPIEVGCQAC